MNETVKLIDPEGATAEVTVAMDPPDSAILAGYELHRAFYDLQERLAIAEALINIARNDVNDMTNGRDTQMGDISEWMEQLSQAKADSWKIKRAHKGFSDYMESKGFRRVNNGDWTNLSSLISKFSTTIQRVQDYIMESLGAGGNR